MRQPVARRSFLKSAAAFSAVTLVRPGTVFGSRLNSAVNIGIIGCGDRGTAVISSISANTPANIIAMADLFEDKLQAKEPVYNKLNAAKGFPAIQKAHIYRGSKAYLQLLQNKDVDAVLISTPAYAHVDILEAAIAAGKHVYCEKPLATDADGCRRVEQAGEKIKGKLSMVAGFQIRYASPYVEMVKRIQRGDIGELVTVQLYYFSSGAEIHEVKDASYDEMRIRNHYHFRAISGGILLDQGIHMLDVCNWTLGSLPVSAVGRGGLKGKPAIGDTFSNFQVLYEYPGDVNVSIHSTKLGPQFGDVCCRFLGTKGIAEAHYSGGVFIQGDNAWDSGIAKSDTKLTPEQQASGVFLSSLHDADANKDQAFINSILTGNYLNEARSGAASTMTAILGRDAATSRTEMTWEEIYFSNERLDPKLDLTQFDR